MAKPDPRTQDASTPVVWLLTDNKPGHRNQLKGLGNRLRVLAGASTYWVDASTVPVPLWRALLGSAPRMEASLPRPDLVIAAGSGTHRLLLALRKLRGTRTLVIMKPAIASNRARGCC
jgi:mitochondrial fission protein ELM1